MRHIKAPDLKIGNHTFHHYGGSKSWPSDDERDSPFDEFICKKCGQSYTLRMYGQFCIGEKTPDEQARDILVMHKCMGDKK